MVEKITGGCQCGDISYTISSKPFVSYTCHCRECQKLSSSAFNTCMQIPSETLLVEGAPISRTRVADSGNRLETWFCPCCGSALYSINSARPTITTIYVGTPQNPETAQVDAHIWTSRKLPWVVLPKAHRIFDEAGDWTDVYSEDIERYKPNR